MSRLVRTFDGHVEVVGLLRGKRRELHAERGQRATRDLFVELRALMHDDAAGLLAPTSVFVGRADDDANMEYVPAAQQAGTAPNIPAPNPAGPPVKDMLERLGKSEAKYRLKIGLDKYVENI